jgi:hypothetical protein
VSHRGEPLLKPGRGRVASQLPKGKGMESCDGKSLRRRQLQKPCKARLQLIGGLLGVGHHQNAGGIGSFAGQIEEAAGERAGFPGPGPRQGQLDLCGALGGGRLRGIEMAHAWPSGTGLGASMPGSSGRRKAPAFPFAAWVDISSESCGQARRATWVNGGSCLEAE